MPIKLMRTYFFILSSFFVLIFVIVFMAEARTLTVDINGEGDFQSIQKAVENATNGDEIQITEGSYSEHVVVNRSVSIIGGGHETTIIDGGGQGDVLRITADNVQLANLSVTGSGSRSPDYGAGIRVFGNNSTISNVLLKNNTHGIIMEQASFGSIMECEFLNINRDGIRLERSNKTTISENNISIDGDSAVNVIRSDHVIISKNSIDNYQKEFGFFNYPKYGVTLTESSSAMITGNTFRKCGIDIISDELEHWNTHAIDGSNLVNQRPLTYYINVKGITITESVGQIIMANCSDMILRDLVLNDSKKTVQIGFSSNITIDNIICHNAIYGIFLFNCTTSTIMQTTIYYCIDFALFIESCSQINIINNLFTLNGAHIGTSARNGIGIMMKYSVQNWIMSNSIVQNSYAGINLIGSSWNTLETNNISQNFGEGVILGYGSSNNFFHHNTISDNWDDGLKIMENSHGTKISDGIYINNWHGISIESSSYCTITSTNISWNDVGVLALPGSDNISVKWSTLSQNDRGIEVSTNAGTVKALNNTWGSDSGPFNALMNPNGEGDLISHNVLFEPWIDTKGGARWVEEGKDKGDRKIEFIILGSLGILIIILTCWAFQNMRNLQNNKNGTLLNNTRNNENSKLVGTEQLDKNGTSSKNTPKMYLLQNVPAVHMYDQIALEKKWQDHWAEKKIYCYDPVSDKPVYSIDNPPRYASGALHAGHAVHYTHIDFAARYKRMRGYNVIFPLCFDVNGIPIEERVERLHGVSPREIGRQKFNELCAEFAAKNIKEMTRQFRILGESMDDTYYYQTNAPHYRRLTQISFIKLYHEGLMYKGEFPINWCPRCHTALADAEVDYGNRMTKLNYIKFRLAENSEEHVLIATTRPELLSTCQIVAVHPEDIDKIHLVGKKVLTPIFNKEVEVIADDKVDPHFGTGIVMICTIGDKDDLEWVYRYKLPIEKGIDEIGNLTELAGKYQGMSTEEGRKVMIEDMKSQGLLVKQEDLEQNVGRCWRCKTPLEFLVKEQWFLKTTPFKNKVWQAANEMEWYPEFMKIRLKEWIDSLEWDWVISRQRFFATPIPIWECEKCGHVVVAEEEQCYVDPTIDLPPVEGCPECGSTEIKGCEDVFDTWMDSSISPLFLARWQQDETQFNRLFPISLRPQAHDIIRTWAFYTILRSVLLTKRPPFEEIMMDGFILSEDGTPMHTSLGNVIDPLDVLDEYGADALRYYAATCSLGMDNAFRFKDIKRGQRLLRKFWNIQMFITSALKKAELEPYDVREIREEELTTVDRWILSLYSGVIERAGKNMDMFQFDKAMKDIEYFMWHEFADDYIEMVKQRIYSRNDRGAASTLYTIGYGLTKLLATYLPHITEEVFDLHYRRYEGGESIHLKEFPDAVLKDEAAERVGGQVKGIVSSIRNWKSESGMPLNASIRMVELVCAAEAEREAKIIQDALAIEKLTFTDSTDLHEEVVAIKPVHAKIGPTFRKKSNEVIAFLKNADPKEIVEKMESGTTVKVSFSDGEEGELTREYVEIEKALVAHGHAVETLKIGDIVAIIER